MSDSFNLGPNKATNSYLREWKALTYAKIEASVHLSLHAGAGTSLFNNIYNIAINYRGSQLPTAHHFLSLFSRLLLFHSFKTAFILDTKHLQGVTLDSVSSMFEAILSDDLPLFQEGK